MKTAAQIAALLLALTISFVIGGSLWYYGHELLHWMRGE